MLTDKAAPGLRMTLSESQSSVSSRTVFYTIRKELLQILIPKPQALKLALKLRPFYLFHSACLIKGLALRL